MKVDLLHHTPLIVDAHACRTCWSSFDNSDTETTKLIEDEDSKWNDIIEDTLDFDEMQIGEADKSLIYKVGNKFKHKSILEHVSYNFFISGISRGCLQELARHRTAKLSVKSSRYTLKELKKQGEFNDFHNEHDYKRASEFLVWTGRNEVDWAIFEALENLRLIIKQGISNDIAKYALPEAYKTELTWTMDARNLQSFLSLRTDKGAHWEIRELAHEIYAAIPAEHKYLFTEFVKIYETKED